MCKCICEYECIYENEYINECMCEYEYICENEYK